uniref:RNA-dependent RNA polymerase n=2 Tax=Combu negative-strand RNA mycovirus TaxID=2507517 RepID=A0A451G5T5_9VIRU|nr:RNA-dependent RNA polymerase [Combu negative-strand RNA mycovirus]
MHDNILENIKNVDRNMIKDYFHLRHDMFGMIIYNGIYGDINMVTDVNLRDLGVDSNKTPDLYYIKNNEEKYIVDFVVTTRLELADHYKGYGFKDIKYTEEANELGAKVIILPLTLKEDNFNILWRNLEILDCDNAEIRRHVIEFREICCNNLKLINETYSKFFQTEFEFQNKSLYDLNYQVKKGKKLMIIDPYNYNLIHSKKKELLYIIHSRRKEFELCLKQDNKIIPIKGKYNSEKVISDLEINFDNIFKYICKYQNGIKCDLTSKEGIFVYVDSKDCDYVDLGIPDNYEEMLINKMSEVVKEKKFMNNELNKNMIKESIKIYEENMSNMNKISYKSKKSFTVPFPDVDKLIPLDYKEINNTLEFFRNGTSDAIVNVIIDEYLIKGGVKKYMLKEKNNEKFRSLKENMNQSVSKYYEKMFEAQKILGNNKPKALKFKEFKEIPGMENIATELNNDMNKQKKLYEEYKIKNSIQVKSDVVSLGIGNKNSLNPKRTILNNSYSHFKDKAKIEGWGNSYVDLNKYNKTFRNVFSNLFNPSPINGIDVDLKQYDDLPGLKKMKKDYINSFVFKDVLLGSKLSSLLRIIQNWANTLMYYSSNNETNKHFYVDNLGFKNLLLIIRAGKSCMRTGNTWDYKIIYPLSDEIKYLDWGDIENSDSSVFFKDNVEYVVTPWTKIKIDLCKYYQTLGISSMLHSVIISQRNHHYKSKNDDTILNDLSINFLLAFSGKRNIETVLHNMRYLLFNLLSDYTDYKKLLPDFVYYNYSIFHSYIFKCITCNLPTLYDSVLNLKTFHKEGLDGRIKNSNIVNLFDNYHIITNKNELADFFYISYNMRKGYYTQALEQKKNLISVLDDINTFKLNNKSQKEYSVNILENDSELFNSDFSYDPLFCKYLGKITGDYIRNIADRSQLDTQLNQVLNKQFDDMSNNKGLRGWIKENFFNRKGYEIVYEYIENVWLKEFPDDELTLGNFIKRYPLLIPKLHQVEKEQRGGSREIYVLDIYTKAYQQIIENYIKKICKYLPNEVISIPSNKRINYIHSRFHERDHNKFKYILNCSLDCRRWGPHSNTEKYINFFKGLQGTLPDDFIKFCLMFFELYEQKRVYTRKYVVDTMVNNEQYKNLIKYLADDDSSYDSVSFKMEYSFMMGIFNYLSSIMHAANQLVCSNIISKYHNKRNNECVQVVCIAHSDDSQARIFADKKTSLIDSFTIYEYLLKCSNHILSPKKCNVNILNQNDKTGSNYLEFLSILYMGNEVVPMLSKFINSLEFYPTDKGYSSDMGQCISKSVEVLTYGGTLAESYLMMKFMSSYIREIYGVNKSSSFDELPYWFLGPIDAHPASILLTGGDSDILRILLTSPERIKFIMKLVNYLGMELESDSGGLGLNWNYSVRINERLKSIRENVEQNWVYSNVKSKIAKYNVNWYKNQLFKSSFYMSLSGANDISKLKRVLTMRSNPSILTKRGLMSINDLKDAISQLNILENEKLENNNLNILNDTDSNHFNEHNILDLMLLIHSFQIDQLKLISDGYNSSNMPIAINYTYKPTLLHLREDGVKTNLKINAGQMITYLRYPEMIEYLGLNANYSRHTIFLEQLIKSNGYDVDNLSDNQYLYILNKLLSKSDKFLYCYSSTPSKQRDIKDSDDFVDWVSNNSIFGYKVSFKKITYKPLKNYMKHEQSTEEFIKFSISYMYLNSLKEGLAEKIKYYYNGKSMTHIDIIKSFGKSLFFDHTIVGKTVEDIPTMIIWKEPQRKYKGKYSGKGQVILISEEIDVIINLNDDDVDFYIDFDNQDLTATFSQETTNFIKSSIYDMLYRHDFTGLPSMYLEGTLVIGEKKNGLSGIGYPNDMNIVYGKVNYDFIDLSNYKTDTIIIDKDRKFKLKNNDKIINFPYEGIYNRGTVLSDRIDINTIPETDLFVLDNLRRVEGTVLRVNTWDVIDNFHRSDFYNCIFNNSFFNKRYNDNPVVEALLENSQYNTFVRDSVLNKEELDDIMRNYGIIPALLPKEIFKLYKSETINYKERLTLSTLLNLCSESDDIRKSLDDIKSSFTEQEIILGLKTFSEKEDWWFEELPPVLSGDKLNYYRQLADEMFCIIYKMLTYIEKNGNALDRYDSTTLLNFLDMLSMRSIGSINTYTQNEILNCNRLKKMFMKNNLNDENIIESYYEDDYKWSPRVKFNTYKFNFIENFFRLVQVLSYPVFFDKNKAILDNKVPYPLYFKISGLKRKRLDLIPKGINKFQVRDTSKNINYTIFGQNMPRLAIPFENIKGFFSYDRDHVNYEDILDSVRYNDDIEDEWIDACSTPITKHKFSKSNIIYMGVFIDELNKTNKINCLTEHSNNILYLTCEELKSNPNIPLIKWKGNLSKLNEKLNLFNCLNIYTTSNSTMINLMRGFGFKQSDNEIITNPYDYYLKGLKASEFQGFNAFLKEAEMKEQLNEVINLRKNKDKNKDDSDPNPKMKDPYYQEQRKKINKILIELGYKESEIKPARTFAEIIEEMELFKMNNIEDNIDKKSIRLKASNRQAIINNDKQALVKNDKIISELESLCPGLPDYLFGDRLTLTPQSKKSLLMMIKLFKSSQKVMTESVKPYLAFIKTFEIIIENSIEDKSTGENKYWNLYNCLDYAIGKFTLIENNDDIMIEPERSEISYHMQRSYTN